MSYVNNLLKYFCLWSRQLHCWSASSKLPVRKFILTTLQPGSVGSAEPQRVREACRYSAFISNYLIIIYTREPHPHSWWLHLFVPGVTKRNEDAEWTKDSIFFNSGVNQGNVEVGVSSRFSCVIPGVGCYSLDLPQVGWCSLVCV